MSTEEITLVDRPESSDEPLIRRRRRPTKRGGNRLKRHQYRAPARYQRRREFAPEDIARTSRYKAMTLFALNVAAEQGLLSPLLHFLMTRLVESENSKTLLKPVRSYDGGDWVECSGIWSTSYIRSLVPDHLVATLDPQAAESEQAEASDDDGGKGEHKRREYDRTGGRWMARLFQLQWVDKIHRSGQVNGEPYGTSNMWRLQIPPALYAEVERMWKDRFKNKNGNRPKNQRAQPPRPKTPAEKSQAQLSFIRSNPCPSCSGTGVPHDDRDVDEHGECGQCHGARTVVGRAIWGT